MKPEDFIQELRRVVIEENNSIYRDLFHNTDINDVTDGYWLNAINLFLKLNNEEREVLFEIMRQASVDTLSNTLSVLDGLSDINNGKNEFKLLVDNKVTINGDLQDIFLEIEETNS